MKPGATFDSSFWVHAVSLHLVEQLLEDDALVCPMAVETELGRDNLSAVRLKTLCAAGRIELATQTGLDVPTIMDAAAKAAGAEPTAVDAFLSAAKSLAEAHADPGFYELAVRAVGAA